MGYYGLEKGHLMPALRTSHTTDDTEEDDRRHGDQRDRIATDALDFISVTLVDRHESFQLFEPVVHDDE